MKKSSFVKNIGYLFSGLTAKVVLCVILVVLGLLIGVKTAVDIKSDAVVGKQDLLFMTDQRLSALVFEINNFPRGPGQDVLFLKDIDSLKRLSNYGRDRAGVISDFKSYLSQSKMFYSISYVDFRDGNTVYLSKSGGSANGFLTEMNREAAGKARLLPENKVYLSDAYESVGGGEKNVLMDYATPVYSDDKTEVVGVVDLSVSINYLLEDIRSYSKQGEQVFLINGSGQYLANSNISKEYVDNTGKIGRFFNDYPDVANSVVTTNQHRIESKDNIFSIKHIYPTGTSFEFFNDRQGGSDYPYHWMLISVLNKRSDNSKVVGDYYFFAAVMMIILASIALIIKNRDLDKRIVIPLLFLMIFFSITKVNAMTVDVNIPEKYKVIEAGDRLYFEIDIRYPDNQERKDIKIEYDLVKGGETITKSKNLKAIESQTSFLDYIVVPEYAKKGEYEMKVVVSDGIIGNGSDNFSVTEKNDNIKFIFYTIVGLIGILSLIIGWETVRLGKIKK